MRKIIIIILCLLFFKGSFSINPGETNNSLLLTKSTNTELKVNNYQHFKFQFVNFESKNHIDYGNFQRRRRSKNNDLMLYVAGGLAVATATLILTNDPSNFTSNSSAGVNLGIAVGGTVACGMIVAKYFIDKGR
jgi:hypothetical protein